MQSSLPSIQPRRFANPAGRAIDSSLSKTTHRCSDHSPKLRRSTRLRAKRLCAERNSSHFLHSSRNSTLIAFALRCSRPSSSQRATWTLDCVVFSQSIPHLSHFSIRALHEIENSNFRNFHFFNSQLFFTHSLTSRPSSMRVGISFSCSTVSTLDGREIRWEESIWVFTSRRLKPSPVH